MNGRKLTDDDRKQIRKMPRLGFCNAKIAEFMNCSVSTVYMVIKGRTWADYYDREKKKVYDRTYREKKSKLAKGVKSE